jgi:hypothetical protein
MNTMSNEGDSMERNGEKRQEKGKTKQILIMTYDIK